MTAWAHKKTFFLVLLAFMELSSESHSVAGDLPGPGMAFVQDDQLTVYQQISTTSKEVATLQKGDVVKLKLEIMGSAVEGPWCRIIKRGKKKIVGFVLCDGLKRDTFSKPEWQRIGEPRKKRKIHETEVIIKNNQVQIPVKITFGYSSEEVLLLLDTGATRTMISSEVADRLNINTSRSKKIQMRVVGGTMVTGSLVELKSIIVGPHTRENMTIAVVKEKKTPNMLNGLLGMDFLKGLQYHIDFEKKVVKWNDS